MYCLCQEYRGRLYPQNKRPCGESEEELDLDYCKEPCEMDVDVAISNSLGLADTMHVSSYRSIRSSKYHVIYQKKAKDAEIIATKVAEEAKGR